MTTTFPLGEQRKTSSSRASHLARFGQSVPRPALGMDDVDCIDIGGVIPISSATVERSAQRRVRRARRAHPARAASTPRAPRPLHHRAHLTRRIADHVRELLRAALPTRSTRPRAQDAVTRTPPPLFAAHKIRRNAPARHRAAGPNAIHAETMTATFGAARRTCASATRMASALPTATPPN